jgi:GT2 family glycosyltransferase
MMARAVALVATYRRPREIARLLAALAQTPHGLELVVVVDNTGCAETRAAVELARCRAHYVSPGENLGCGGGLRRAGEEALRLAGDRLTHLWILDDDAVPAPETLAGLVEAMEREQADAACPLVIGPDGMVGWTPGLADRALHRLAEKPASPAEFRERLGSAPLDFTWTQGISLLVSRRAIDALGLHRADFWVRGEDLEFSLRITASYRGIFVPSLAVQHLPPAETGAASREAEYLKHAAMLQNVAFVGLRLAHGRRIAWTVPANVARFIRAWGLRAVSDALRALWRGAAKGEPAGAGTGATFLKRFEAIK